MRGFSAASKDVSLAEIAGLKVGKPELEDK
jgi:hypothetical protein